MLSNEVIEGLSKKIAESVEDVWWVCSESERWGEPEREQASWAEIAAVVSKCIKEELGKRTTRPTNDLSEADITNLRVILVSVMNGTSPPAEDMDEVVRLYMKLDKLRGEVEARVAASRVKKREEPC